MTVKLKKLHPDAQLPKRMTAGAAGMDMRALVFEDVVLLPGARAVIGCGFAMELPAGYEAQIRPRSGLAIKNGITVLNAPGTIDEDYRGQVGAILINHGTEPFTIRNGERIAQMVIAKVEYADVVEVEELSDTTRGAGGMGSTGTL